MMTLRSLHSASGHRLPLADGSCQAPLPELLDAPRFEHSQGPTLGIGRTPRGEPMQPSSSWPNDVAYLEAIQTPSVCFSEPRLKAALIYSNDMGMPQAATGRSAIVFRADVDSADVALRCFTREAEGQQKRYQDLHEHLAHSIPRYMVDFIYWDREILVDGTRYPVVEMGWVEGQPLHLWVEQHLQRPYHLVRLAAIWLKVVEDLHARRMAHGDLSSDNCLVTGHKLKLIDYDDF